MKLRFARRPTLPALGERSPALEVRTLDGARWTLAESSPRVFTLVVFYHGHHCPVCRAYVGELDRKEDAFTGRGVEVIAVSGDSAARAERSRAEWMLGRLRLGYGLTERQMRTWGLSVAHGTQPNEPAVFNDPGVFLVRPDGVLFYAALTSLPVGRPRFDDLLEGIDYVLAREAPSSSGG